ncbi:MAG: RNase P subunit p30 family protein [Candidatus Hermodarchaeota archaeon]
MIYFESRLPLNHGNIEDIQQKLQICRDLGIKNVILDFENSVKNITPELKRGISKFSELNLHYRTTFKSKNLDELKERLKQGKNYFEIISVESPDKQVQIKAAKDSRVDLISFSDEDIIKTITPGVISLTKQNNSFIEFSLEPIMIRNKALQSRFLRNIYRALQLAMQLNANYIISGNFHDLFKIRHPRALISLCHTLLDVPLLNAKKAFSENVIALINRAKMRQNKDFIESGVKLIKGGEA